MRKSIKILFPSFVIPQFPFNRKLHKSKKAAKKKQIIPRCGRTKKRLMQPASNTALMNGISLNPVVAVVELIQPSNRNRLKWRRRLGGMILVHVDREKSISIVTGRMRNS